MSHQPNWQEYGNPMVSSGNKTAVDVHESIYGCYEPLVLEPTKSKASSEKFQQVPFTIKK